jgi:hypothetical protein
VNTRPCCPTRCCEYTTGPRDVSLTAAATASMIGAATINPTSDMNTSSARFANRWNRLFLKPGEKISQLGRRFSTAILPVYFS